MKIILSICVLAVAVAFGAETNLTLTVDGITYKGVRFGRVTPVSVTIFHATGVATIPLEKLPPELQEQFGYDRQKAAGWRASQQQAAAEAAEARRKAAAAVEWTLTVERVLPDGIIAKGCRTSEARMVLPPPPNLPANDNQGSAPATYCPSPLTICLVEDPHIDELAEGNKFIARACKEGVITINGRALEKWAYYGPMVQTVAVPPPAQPVTPEAPVPVMPPPIPGAAASSLAELRAKGAFGFPQKDAEVLFDHPALRFSVWSNDQYLFAQAILWTDGDASVVTNANGYTTGDSSELWLDLNDDGKMTRDVDRQYRLNPRPSLPGLFYQIPKGEGSRTGMKSDTHGRGAVRYVEVPFGKRVRVDTYLVPLDEISKHPGDRVRVCYWGRSPKPSFTLSTTGTEDIRVLYLSDKFVRLSSGQIVLARGGAIDPDKVPDGRQDAFLPAQ